MIWTQDFISRALDGLPKDKYRQRAQAELTDHLLELAYELESGGYCAEEAQARALELMGEPSELKQEFQNQWKQQARQLKFLIPNLVKTAFNGFLFRVFVRLFLFYPAFFVGNKLFPDLSLSAPVSLVLLALINFWPGTQFISAENHRFYSLLESRERRNLAFHTSLLSWAEEVLLIISVFFVVGFSYSLVEARGGEYDPVMHSFFLFITGQGPLMFQQDFLYLGIYFAIGLVVCICFPLLYRPRSNPGGEIS